MDILNVEHLQKSFGNNQVIKDLSFSVPEHSVFGFLGQNGAGKTTTMKMILGLERPDAGEIYVLGEKVCFGATKTNRSTGYLPDVPEFYPFMTAKEYLLLCSKITGMKRAARKKRVAEMLALVDLADVQTKIGGFSRGMKQRLGIAQALLNKPKLLICDEPTSALDPNGRREFLDLLYSLRHETTILFSTHILNDVERICDHIGILDQGKIVVATSIADLKKEYSQKQLRIVFENENDKQKLLAHLHVFDVQPLEEELTLLLTLSPEKSKQLLQLLTQLDILPLVFEQKTPSLEEIFLEVIE